MNIRILTGGQSGVDRGAWRGAVECGLARGGWMPADQRDEHGPIPDAVRMDLRPALNGGGNRSRTIENVIDADAVLIVVVDASRGCVTPGTRLTWRQAGVKQRSRLIVDDSEAMLARCATWMRELSRWWAVHIDNPLRPMNLMIAGPRASLWPEGEATARRIVRAIAEACRG